MAKVFTITEGLENLGALKTGGQGSVYKGRRIGEIITAIKLLPTPVYSESAKDKNFAAFQNEVQKLQKVNEEPNPNVVKILSYGITDSGNFPFIEMEYIEGPDLEELLHAPHDPVFTVKEVLKVADHLSSALAHCHKRGVKHGDIKSNNVKYNAGTGNYVLLDFGLSVMSDEQRRTSIRHAGAIEFMAPEQNEGEMLFQSDVYSFGIILFELLTGKVPFPLNDKGETARNRVMVAHIEALPPDVLPLRSQSLPDNWTSEKKKDEMQVPDWLTSMMYKCLEKKPQDRFGDGIELNKYIRDYSINIESKSRPGDINSLEHENRKLRRENQQLQQQLLQHRQYSQAAKTSNSTGFSKERNNETFVTKSNESKAVAPKNAFKKTLILTFSVLVALGAIVYLITANQDSKFLSFARREPIGEYKVIADRAFVYKEADKNTRTNYSLIRAKTVKAFNEKEGFLYAEITDQNGLKKGWLRRQDLIKADEWVKRNKLSEPANERTTAQLENARRFLNSGKTVEALIIYSSLAKQGVPEAMYQYGKTALQNFNHNINCAEAFNLLKKAAEKGYIPAKRTLGFLYAFAQDPAALQQNNYYERCKINKNVKRGSKLLMEATLEGDTTARRLLDDLEAKELNIFQ